MRSFFPAPHSALGLILIPFLSFASPAHADVKSLTEIKDRSTLLIECRARNGQELTNAAGGMLTAGNILKGTGVLVSESGHVLTAAHVIDGFSASSLNCAAYFNKPSGVQVLSLSLEDEDDTLDALIFKVQGAPAGFDFSHFLRYCKIDSVHQLQPLVAIGFPGNSQSRQVSVRAGILGTTERTDGEKLLETDILTTAGMSGGPVVFAGNTHLAGIVTEAKENQLGTADFFAILPIAQMNTDLLRHMKIAPKENCAPMRLQHELDRALADIEVYKGQIAALTGHFEAFDRLVGAVSRLKSSVDALDGLADSKIEILQVFAKIRGNERAAPHMLDTRLGMFEQILDWDVRFSGNHLRVKYRGLAEIEITPVESLEVTTKIRLKESVNGDIDTVIAVGSGIIQSNNELGGRFNVAEFRREIEDRVKSKKSDWKALDEEHELELVNTTTTFNLNYKLAGDPTPRTEPVEIDVSFIERLLAEGTP